MMQKPHYACQYFVSQAPSPSEPLWHIVEAVLCAIEERCRSAHDEPRMDPIQPQPSGTPPCREWVRPRQVDGGLGWGSRLFRRKCSAVGELRRRTAGLCLLRWPEVWRGATEQKESVNWSRVQTPNADHFCSTVQISLTWGKFVHKKSGCLKYFNWLEQAASYFLSGHKSSLFRQIIQTSNEYLPHTVSTPLHSSKAPTRTKKINNFRVIIQERHKQFC